MKINYNIPALKVVNILNKANEAQSSSMERLSSGLQISSSKDDPAGMAISLKMRAQLDSLAQASRNSSDAISLIQTAESSLSSAHEITKRIREVAVQSANETYTDADREKIQIEVDELIKELDRLSNETDFNQHKILSGDKDLADSGFQITQTGKYNGLQAQYSISLNMPNPGDKFNIDGQPFEFYDSSVSTTLADPTAIGLDLQGDWKKDLSYASLPNFNIDPTGTDLVLTAKNPGSSANTNPINVTDDSIAPKQITQGIDSKEYATYEIVLPSINSGPHDPEPHKFQAGSGFTIDGVVFEFYDREDYDNGEYDGAGVGIATTKDDGSYLLDFDLASIVKRQEYPNFHLDTVNMGTSYDPMVLTAKNSGIAGDYLAGYDGGFVDLKLSVQTGSEANQLTQIDIASSKPDTLGLTSKTPIYGFTDYLILNDDPLTAANENRYGISLLTMEDSQFALGAVDRAIAEISSRRAYLGATQNRLEYTVKNISNNSVNLDGARSRIQDTDMAKEMVLFTKDGILSQAANAMLAQANQRPQQVFQLLQS